MAKKGKINKPVADQLRSALIANGYREPQLSMLMAQAAHETGGFYKEKAIENNNFGGVKYRKTMQRVAVPSEDYFAPWKEEPKPSTNAINGKAIKEKRRVPYARFTSINDFVKAWIPTAHLNGQREGNTIGAPLDANSLEEYVHRLTLNHYHQDTERNYLKGLKRWDAILQETYQSSAAGKDETEPPKQIEKLRETLNAHKKYKLPFDLSHTSKLPGNLSKIHSSFIEQIRRTVAPDSEAQMWFRPLHSFFSRTPARQQHGGDKGNTNEVRIQCNSPLIEKFTIKTVQMENERDSFRQKMEGILLEILDTAN